MKKIIIALVLIVLCITSNVLASDVPTANVYDLFRDSTVSIFSVGNGGSGLCSGTVIENKLHRSVVLTAKHCIGLDEEMYVEYIDVAYIATSTDDDLALLILNSYIPYKKPVKFADANIYKGEQVFHIGYPDLSKYEVDGIVYLPKGDSHYAKMTVISGCSGGGLFNKYGELVGVVWGSLSLNWDKNLTIYEPLSDITKFIKDINDSNN